MGWDPSGYWDFGWEELAVLGTTVLVAGLSLLLAIPTGGASIAVGTVVISSTTAVTVGSTMVVAGTVIVGDAAIQATVNYAKKSKKSEKEK